MSQTAEEFLAHAGAADYDPVARREYYLKTRELKGRPKAALEPLPAKTKAPPKSPEQKAAEKAMKDIARAKKAGNKAGLAKAKETIRKNQQFESNALRFFSQVQQKALIEAAEKARTEIKEKLEKALGNASSERQRKLDSLPKVPDNASTAVRFRIEAARQKEIALINQAANNDRKSANDSAGTDREKVTSELKGAIDTARENFRVKFAEMQAKYASQTQSAQSRYQKS